MSYLSKRTFDPNFNFGSKRRYNSKRQPRKTVRKKKVYTNKQLSRKVRSINNRVEKKYLDYTTTETPAINTPYATSLISHMTRGDQYNEREGDQVRSNRLWFSYRLFRADSVLASIVRVLIFWDTSPQSAFVGFTGPASGPPTAAEETNALFDDRTTAVSTIAPFNQMSRKRYKILYDRTHILNPESSSTHKTVLVKRTINLSSALVQFIDVEEGTIDSLANRNLVFFMVTSSLAATITFNSRFFYTDK